MAASSSLRRRTSLTPTRSSPQLPPRITADQPGRSGLLSTSPAVNHADETYSSPRDQRGYFRTGASDSGAFEYQGGLIGRAVEITRTGTSLSDITVSFEAVDRLTYTLQRKLNLSDTTWQNIAGVNNLTAAANDIESIKAPGDLSLGKAFYRVAYVSGP